MSKMTRLHSIFRKKSIYGANIGFHTLTLARSLGRCRCLKPRTTGLVVIEGHLIRQVYMDEVLRYVVLPFCAKTSGNTMPWMTLSEHISLESAKTIMCALTGQFGSSDMSTILTDLCHFGQRVQRIIMAPRNPQPLDAVLQEILILIPQDLITSIQGMRKRR